LAARLARNQIRSGAISGFRIPTDQPEESDGTATWNSTTMVVIELQAEDATGLGFTYSDLAAAQVARELIHKEVLGQDAFDIPAIHSALDREVRNMGRPGLASTAISAIDTCLWDLKARILDCPLIKLFGQRRERIPAYGSGGFTSYSERQLVDQLTGWAAEGMRFVKMKIGRQPAQDVTRVGAVQKALNGKAEIFVDSNGAYSRKQALQQAEQFATMGVSWFEEPVSSDDRIGLHLLVERAPAGMNIAAGEYCYVLDDAQNLLSAGAVDVMQADATRCGGISNFIKIAGACEMYHVPLSAHTAPSIHTSLCCSLPAAIHVEYFHDHARIEKMLFDGAVRPVDGDLQPDQSSPGMGLVLKTADAEKFRVFSAGVRL
jgi:L-alanine-DL-glutamate epimerase-like enolase superfamily enzyme